MKMLKIWSKISAQLVYSKIDKEKIAFFAVPAIILSLLAFHLMAFNIRSVEFMYNSVKNMVYGAYFTSCSNHTNATGNYRKLKQCYLDSSNYRKSIFQLDNEAPALEVIHADRYKK